MERFVIYLMSVLLFASCDKEYFPDEDAYRDTDLVGTWSFVNKVEDYPVYEVFTSEGYMGEVAYTENYSSKNSLSAIYSTNSEDSIVYEHSRFRNGKYSRKLLYKLSLNKDTLLLEKQLDTEKWDTLLRSKYQLIYDGPHFVRVDTIQ